MGVEIARGRAGINPDRAASAREVVSEEVILLECRPLESEHDISLNTGPGRVRADGEGAARRAAWLGAKPARVFGTVVRHPAEGDGGRGLCRGDAYSMTRSYEAEMRNEGEGCRYACGVGGPGESLGVEV